MRRIVLSASSAMLLWVVAACAGEVTSDSSTIPMDTYSSPMEIVDAMDSAGIGCVDVQEVVERRPDDEPYFPTSNVGCFWPSGDDSFPEDRIAIAVFDSVDHRLQFLIALFNYGCGAGPRVGTSIAYAYGPTWLVASDYGVTGVEFMGDVATALGGQANAASCSSVAEFANSFPSGTYIEDPFQDITLDELTDVLGE